MSSNTVHCHDLNAKICKQLEGIIRFNPGEGNSAVKALERMENKAAVENDGKIQFEGHDIECKVPEGEEEEKLWFEIAENMSAEKNHTKKRGHVPGLAEALAEKIAANTLKKAFKKQMKKHGALKYSDHNQSADDEFLKGQILHISGLPTENVDFALLKDFFRQIGPVKYTDYEEGSSEANIRFHSRRGNAAVKALKIMDEAAKECGGKILFLGHEIQGKVLEGEEEEKYWLNYAEEKKQWNFMKTRDMYNSKVETEESPKGNNNTGLFDYFKGMLWN